MSNKWLWALLWRIKGYFNDEAFSLICSQFLMLCVFLFHLLSPHMFKLSPKLNFAFQLWLTSVWLMGWVRAQGHWRNFLQAFALCSFSYDFSSQTEFLDKETVTKWLKAAAPPIFLSSWSSLFFLHSPLFFSLWCLCFLFIPSSFLHWSILLSQLIGAFISFIASFPGVVHSFNMKHFWEKKH